MKNCKDLRPDEEVVFLVYSRLFDRKVPVNGNVLSVDDTAKTVHVCYLEGYRSEAETVRYADMLAVFDPDGPFMKFDNIHGKSRLLEGGVEFVRRTKVGAYTYNSEKCPLGRNEYLL